MLKNILFDLDGTLLPMNQSEFVKLYFKLITTKLTSFNIEPQIALTALNAGIKSMIKNNGETTNYNCFWSTFCKISNTNKNLIEPALLDFYLSEFNETCASCTYTEYSRKLIDLLKQKGYNIILTTNALFPIEAIKTRLSWVKLSPDDFSFITTYDRSSFCKPNPNYFKEVIDKGNLKADECLMVGNDVEEDMCINKIGINSYLITDCIEHGADKDISKYQKGSLAEFYEFVKALPPIN